jgi:diadenylate cyclase
VNLQEKLKALQSALDDPRIANVISAIDVLLVAYLVYKLLSMIRGTRAWRILGGIVIFVLALWLSSTLHLHTLYWLLDKATLLGPVALVILLLPELRQALEGFGKLGKFTEKLSGYELHTEAKSIEEIVAAVTEMAAARVGALIVLERVGSLDEVIGNGVRLDARVSAPLLNSVFYTGNPLHDGAAIIRGDIVVAAACRLPLSESSKIDSMLHMRHRAAAGVTESVDCLAIVVSEERGVISIASEGRLRRLGSHIELREILNKEFRGGENRAAPRRPRPVPVKKVRR